MLQKDPKEATRERIERLKREGVVDPDDPGAIPPARVPALKPGRIAVAEVPFHHCAIMALSVAL